MNNQQKIWNQLNKNWFKWDNQKDCYVKRKLRQLNTTNLKIVLKAVDLEVNKKGSRISENAAEHAAWQPVIRYVQKLLDKRNANFKLSDADVDYYFGTK
tara:strand:- start:46 stop:342 length:297 start_codon:yes stop_codon:yes gene_type:complete